MKTRLACLAAFALALALAACGGGGGGGGGGSGSGAPTLVSVTLAPSNPTLAFGVTQQMTASGQYSDGSTQDLTGVAAWQSSATAVATVTAGLVTSLAVGQTSITATAAGISGAVGVRVKGVVDLARTGQVTSHAPSDDGAHRAGLAWPSPRFTTDDCGTPANNSDDVVTDRLTGLMWVRDHGGATTRTWQGSLDYANALSLCGFTDWRLANVNELESLMNAGEIGVTWLPTQGFIVSQASFWSSTTDALHADRAWNVDVYGDVGEYPKTSTSAAWAVRGPSAAGALALARTGQTTCHDAAGTALSCVGTGQDGEFAAGAPWPSSRFRVDDCGTPSDTLDDLITDNLTGLTWLRQANRFGPRAWSDAVADADGLSVCGQTDWRLPNQRELRSLVNHGQAGAGNWLAQQGFENLQAANSLPCYWTSTSAPFDSTNRAACGFLFKGILSVIESKSATHFVLPVRGGQ